LEKREEETPNFRWKRGEERIVEKVLVFEEFLSPQQSCRLIELFVGGASILFSSFFFFFCRFGFVSGSVECERETSARERELWL
jgi:hypothetical protein